MPGTYLLHQADTLHCLEFLSIDEKYRASGLWVKVPLQRKHPSIQSHSTPGTEPDIWIYRADTEARAAMATGEEVEFFPSLAWRLRKPGKGYEGPRLSVRILDGDHFYLWPKILLYFKLTESKDQTFSFPWIYSQAADFSYAEWHFIHLIIHSFNV